MSGPWLGDDEQATWRAYVEMQQQLEAAIERNFAESGMSGADYALLVPLSESANDEVRARDLALRVGWDRSRLSHQIRRMEQRGLITRRNCPTDARGTMIALTPAGRAAVEATAPGHAATVKGRFMDVLEPGDRQVIRDVSARVLKVLAAECAAAKSVPCSPPEA
jgi:DNA-binding MarR family transcriptional regulator